MTTPLLQGEHTIARLCTLADVSRAGYYRHWVASAPRQEETCIRDAIQRVVLANKFYGYRRVAYQLVREGFVVNHKRVLRLMREDNLLCLRKRSFVPMTTDSKHSWHVVPNLARGMQLTGLYTERLMPRLPIRCETSNSRMNSGRRCTGPRFFPCPLWRSKLCLARCRRCC